MNGKRIACAGLIAVAPSIALMLASGPADAIPAWARKYDMECSSCHFGSTNKLTKFGRDFLLRGLRTKDDEGITDVESVRLANYLSQRTLFQFTADEKATPTTSFNTSFVHIFSGGPLYQNFSFFTRYAVHPSASLSEGYLEYGSNHASNEYFAARAGFIAPQVVQSNIFVRRPMTIFTNVGGGNTWTPNSKSNGVAAMFTTGNRTFLEAGIINGGAGADTNEFKDHFVTAEQWFDEFGSSISAYWYRGRASVTGPPAWQQNFTRFGINGQFMRDNWMVGAAWMTGKNDLVAGGTRKPTSYYIEAAFNPNPSWTVYSSYENFDPDLAAATKAIAVGASYRLHQIGRLNFETTFSKVTGGTSRTSFNFSLDWMF